MTVAELSCYDRVAIETAGLVIRRYSTSFALAARLLGRQVRDDVGSIYALVRVADEVVDGVADAAGLEAGQVTQRIDALEAETELAMRDGYSTNLVVHAFALTARRSGFGIELTRPFFASMRADIVTAVHTRESFARYVYGSAEVVGVMCLSAFLHGHTLTHDQRAVLIEGARHLGAAFQKVNFLRDLAADYAVLGRCYFPDLDVEKFSERDKHALLDDIENDLRVSAKALSGLPRSSRRAVALAHELFAELARRLRATPAQELLRARVRVPNRVKVRLALLSALGRTPAVNP